MKYSEAVDYLDGKVVLGVKPSLDRIIAVCSRMGYPQNAFDSIQVTGTNGKTSVSRMAAAILKKCGFHVGLFTSPHLETVRERIRVGDRMISVEEFADALADIKPLIEDAEGELGGRLTYFEVVTALAYHYFRSREVGVAVLEVGMGGRWDATNVVDSEVSVITNIDMDHTAELGETLEEIAFEKVGIVNEGAVLVTSEARRKMLLMIAERCEEVGAEMKVLGRDFRIEFDLPYRVKGEPPAQVLSIRGLEGREFRDIRLPLLGKHQAVNAACAVAAAQAYADPREKTDPEVFRDALEATIVPGRLEILGRRPTVVADGAHNVLGIDRLAAAITGEFEYEKLVVVVAVLGDKDARGMLRILGAIADELVVTENRSTRSIRAERLGGLCRIEGIECRAEPDFSKAFTFARELAGPDGLVCVTGSLFTVSEVRIHTRRQKPSKEGRQDR